MLALLWGILKLSTKALTSTSSSCLEGCKPVLKKGSGKKGWLCQQSTDTAHVSFPDMKVNVDYTTNTEFSQLYITIGSIWFQILIYRACARFTFGLYFIYVLKTVGICLKFGGIPLMLCGLYSREVYFQEMINLVDWRTALACTEFRKNYAEAGRRGCWLHSQIWHQSRLQIRALSNYPM